MYAGAPSLIVSLWQVNDMATALIMEDFYKNISEGMRKDMALRKAKINFLENNNSKTAHPAFWSPFIQIGNCEPVTIIKKKNYTPVWIAAGLLLLTTLGFLYRKKKKAL
jgi:LPXTG-motif cell wall-anchored protein